MKNLFFAIAAVALLASCDRGEEIIHTVVTPVAPPDSASKLLGFYLLNEGNMGTNKSTLDYFDATTGSYHRNIYGDANPAVPKELGDVGNDLQVYGGRLYAVINCSNKVEVMDRRTTRRLGQIDIPNCRYIAFHEGYAYVTSYAGPVQINPDYKQLGYVAKVDTATLKVVARCVVGFQPDELAVVGSKIYVANSGGYMVPKYESTLSVIDLATFKELRRVEVAPNLHRLRADRHGVLWVSSRGDYYNLPPTLSWVDTRTDSCGGVLDIATTDMVLDGDSLFLYGAAFSYGSHDYATVYGIVDVVKKQVLTRNFLADGAEGEIAMPSGIMVDRHSKDIYLTDAANHVYPGALLCFDRHGKKRWQVQAGDIPAHFAAVYEE